MPLSLEKTYEDEGNREKRQIGKADYLPLLLENNLLIDPKQPGKVLRKSFRGSRSFDVLDGHLVPTNQPLFHNRTSL
jgi:hypothetical protein